MSNKELMTKLIEQNMCLITQNQEFKDLIKQQNQTIIQIAEKNVSNYNNISNNNINNNRHNNIHSNTSYNNNNIINTNRNINKQEQQ